MSDSENDFNNINGNNRKVYAKKPCILPARIQTLIAFLHAL